MGYAKVKLKRGDVMMMVEIQNNIIRKTKRKTQNLY